MNHDFRIKLLTSLHLMAVAVTLSLLGTFSTQPRTALADTPFVVVVSKWDSTKSPPCNLFPYGAYDVDTFARDDLDAMSPLLLGGHWDR